MIRLMIYKYMKINKITYVYYCINVNDSMYM